MILFNRFKLIVQLFFCSAIIDALPPLGLPLSASLNVLNSSNHTARVGVPSKKLTSFPPGPPSDPFYYTIPDTDLAIHFAPLGLIRGRNETLVVKVLRDALYASLNYRVTAKMPGHGYQLQERECLLSISHSARMHDLTWGMWTIVLTAMTGYVQAYAYIPNHNTSVRWPGKQSQLSLWDSYSRSAFVGHPRLCSQHVTEVCRHPGQASHGLNGIQKGTIPNDGEYYGF